MARLRAWWRSIHKGEALIHVSFLVAIVWNVAFGTWFGAFAWAAIYLLRNIWAALEDICVALEKEDE